MSISLIGLSSNRRGGASEEPLDAFFSDSLIFPSLPDHPGHAHDVAAAANTQVDWKETTDAHVFKADLPGLGKQEVKVQVDEGRVLQISGKRKKEETSPSDRWHRVERSQGSFLRRFKLPKNTKVDEVKAAMENGVLTVTVPKTVPPKPKSNIRTIEIS